MRHPENSDELNDMIDMVEGSQIVKVYCHGCQMPRVMNAVYANFIAGGISNCRFCRDSP
jgi:hypothetical protein